MSLWYPGNAGMDRKSMEGCWGRGNSVNVPLLSVSPQSYTVAPRGVCCLEGFCPSCSKKNLASLSHFILHPSIEITTAGWFSGGGKAPLCLLSQQGENLAVHQANVEPLHSGGRSFLSLEQIHLNFEAQFMFGTNSCNALEEPSCSSPQGHTRKTCPGKSNRSQKMKLEKQLFMIFPSHFVSIRSKPD